MLNFAVFTTSSAINQLSSMKLNGPASLLLGRHGWIRATAAPGARTACLPVLAAARARGQLLATVQGRRRRGSPFSSRILSSLRLCFRGRSPSSIPVAGVQFRWPRCRIRWPGVRIRWQRQWRRRWLGHRRECDGAASCASADAVGRTHAPARRHMHMLRHGRGLRRQFGSAGFCASLRHTSSVGKTAVVPVVGWGEASARLLGCGCLVPSWGILRWLAPIKMTAVLDDRRCISLCFFGSACLLKQRQLVHGGSLQLWPRRWVSFNDGQFRRGCGGFFGW